MSSFCSAAEVLSGSRLPGLQLIHTDLLPPAQLPSVCTLGSPSLWPCAHLAICWRRAAAGRALMPEGHRWCGKCCCAS